MIWQVKAGQNLSKGWNLHQPGLNLTMNLLFTSKRVNFFVTCLFVCMFRQENVRQHF